MAPKTILAFVLLTAAWMLIGVAINPYLATGEDQLNALLVGAAVIGLLAVAVSGFNAYQRSLIAPEPQADWQPQRSPWSWMLLVLILVFWLILARPYWQSAPRYIDDDLINLKIAESWQQTSVSIFKPFNEHLLPVTRLWAFVAVQTTTPQSLPYALLAGLAFLFCLSNFQLFLLARREFKSDSLALIANALFSLTYVHHEVWWWFMAGQWLLTLNLLLAVLLILDPARPSATRANIAAVLSALAPFQFSIGLIVGPVAAAWIFLRWKSFRSAWWRPLFGALVGFLITAPIIKFGLAADDPGKYNIKLKWFAFDPWLALSCSVRLTVDHLIMRNLGVPIAMAPPILAAILFAAAICVIVMVFRTQPNAIRGTPFLVILLLGYGLVIPFRSWMDYPQMSTWTARYQLFPHLGLVLFAVSSWFEIRQSQLAIMQHSPQPSLRLALIVAVLLFAYQETTHAGWR